MKQQIHIGIICDNYILFKGLEKMINKTSRFKIVTYIDVNFNNTDYIDPSVEDPDIFILCFDNTQASYIINKLNLLYSRAKLLMVADHAGGYKSSSMERYGIHGILSKYSSSQELERAILSVYFTGKYYYGKHNNWKTPHALAARGGVVNITTLEKNALILLSSEMEISEIANNLDTTERIVNAYMKLLLRKFKVKSRAGLAICAHSLGVLHYN